MDFATKLQELEQRVGRAKAAAQAAATEPHDRLKQRIDERERELDEAVVAAEDRLAVDAQDRWAQALADAADRRNAVKAKIKKRARAVDAVVAAKEADWADADAAAALEFAAWAVDGAALAVLNAISARSHAHERATAASAQ
jgi:hypothetical protein